MNWIHRYQLFLFDFDGILVNTEMLHYHAYKKMCQDRGVILEWDFDTYCNLAMFRQDGIQEAMYQDYPILKQKEPSWRVLYEEKKRAYQKLLQEERVALMPGVDELLETLQEAGIKRCVVTHSSKEQVSLIRSQIPLLNSIQHWVTREDYSQPKPSPECYLKAIGMHAKKEDRIIGFEDSPRGLKALMSAQVEARLISPFFKKEEIVERVGDGFKSFSSFPEFFLSERS